jgi:ADP-heptose:LPS heptosyltransferase
MPKPRKALIIRFSSFGDILQCFPAAQHLKLQGFDEVHWLTREDFKDLVSLNPYVDKTIGFRRSEGLKGLVAFAFELRKHSYELIYDAHNNLRSHILCAILRWGSHFVRRKKFRLRRYLLFRWKLNLFNTKVIGRDTYLQPLSTSTKNLKGFQNVSSGDGPIVLVPGAAWPLKQWPVQHWLELIRSFPNEKFIILGGKSDAVCFEIANRCNSPLVKTLAGQLSYAESYQLIKGARAVISNDTGLLHAADLFEIPTIALIGPSAFGYPASNTSHVAEVQLWCKPCSKDGRGRCKNTEFMKCMRDIKPESVAKTLGALI